MKNKLRIAFCFSGQARTFDYTYRYFRKNIFNPAKEQGFEYDIFCAVEDDNDAEKIYVMNPTVVEKIKSSEVEKIIKEKYGDLLKSKEFYIYNSIKYPSINFFQQYYKVWRANELKNRHKELSNVQYDIVFKLRYDLLFFNKLDFKKVLKVVSEGNFLSNISIYDNTSKQTGLNSYFSQPFIISDYIAFGSENIIDIYSNAFINFDKIFTSKYKIEKKLKNIIILGIDFLFDKFCKCIYFLSGKSNRFNDKIIEPLYYVKGIILLKKIFIYFPESIQSQNLIINNVEVVNGDFNYFLLRLDYVNRFGRESIFEDF